ncbi:MAG: ATP-dependent helicase [Pseudomonadota bacterium]
MNETWWVKQSDLDDKQLAILVEPPESELLILGPPGSGKTNLLLLRANYVRHVGPKTLFLTFTRTLAEFLRSGASVGRADQIQPGDIKTFMGWAGEVIWSNGGEAPEKGSDFEETRLNTIAALEKVVQERGLRDLYDFAFVDEVQDLRTRELDLIRRLASRMNTAGDSRQRIFNHREGLVAASALTSKTVTLEKHYRIGLKICQFADRILPPSEGTMPLTDGCNYAEEVRSSSVDAVKGASAADTYEECLARLKEQIRYIVDEPIGVLAPSRSVRDAFWDALRNDGELNAIAMRQQENNYQAFGADSRIRVMTVHSSKGSEFRAVHLLEAEAYKQGNRELAFTAVTRAKTEVMLYHVAPLANHMVPPSGALPTNLDSLF